MIFHRVTYAMSQKVTIKAAYSDRCDGICDDNLH